jgi:phage terminase large subunit GpA
LPRSPQISGDRKDELFAFDGVDALWQSWRDGLTPDASLQVSEWADRHRFLSPRASAEPGRYRTGRTPYMRAIMDALSPSNPCRRIVFMKAAQVGATEAGKIGLAMSSTMHRGRCSRCSRPSNSPSGSRASASIR